jgi:hypothetical protein
MKMTSKSLSLFPGAGKNGQFNARDGSFFIWMPVMKTSSAPSP